MIAHATRAASARGAQTVSTTELLLGVMAVYGAEFDRVLHAFGSRREEWIERLEAGAAGFEGE